MRDFRIGLLGFSVTVCLGFQLIMLKISALWMRLGFGDARHHFNFFGIYFKARRATRRNYLNYTVVFLAFAP